MDKESGMNEFFPFPLLLRSIRILFLAFLFSLVFYIPASFADPSTAPRFATQGEVVVDRQSGLMWQRGDSYHELQKGLNWYDALEYMDGKNAQKFAGHSDWRFPTFQELKPKPFIVLAGVPALKRPFFSEDSTLFSKIFASPENFFLRQ